MDFIELTLSFDLNEGSTSTSVLVGLTGSADVFVCMFPLSPLEVIANSFASGALSIVVFCDCAGMIAGTSDSIAEVMKATRSDAKSNQMMAISSRFMEADLPARSEQPGTKHRTRDRVQQVLTLTINGFIISRSACSYSRADTWLCSIRTRGSIAMLPTVLASTY